MVTITTIVAPILLVVAPEWQRGEDRQFSSHVSRNTVEACIGPHSEVTRPKGARR